MSTHGHNKHDEALVSRGLSLPTASTFHSPPFPKTEGSPILHVPSLPDRSLTSPKALEQLIQMSERAIDDIINRFDHTFSGLLEKTQDTKQGLTAPAYLEANRHGYRDSGPSVLKDTKVNEDIFCDSGLGSSLASSLCEETTFEFSTTSMPYSLLVGDMLLNTDTASNSSSSDLDPHS